MSCEAHALASPTASFARSSSYGLGAELGEGGLGTPLLSTSHAELSPGMEAPAGGPPRTASWDGVSSRGCPRAAGGTCGQNVCANDYNSAGTRSGCRECAEHPCPHHRLRAPGGRESGIPEGIWKESDTPLTQLSCYTRRYSLMGVWLLVLAGGYLVERVACLAGLPYDCITEPDYYEYFSDLSDMALYGGLLGWALGVLCPHRFEWLASRHQWYLWVVYLGTPPVYSAISNVPALKHDLVSLKSWGAAFIVLETLGLCLILGVIGWHIREAWQTRPRSDFLCYLVSRLLVLLWFGGSAAAMSGGGGAEGEGMVVHMHLHHLYIGLGLAMWAEENHPLSGLTLAIGAGIFTQGVSAYSFAPVFTPGDCLVTPANQALNCSFWADSPFTLQVCPGSGGHLPQHSCT